MEIYETEEEQVAAIKRWWKENGTSTIIGVVLGVAILVGWNIWKQGQQDTANKASAIYSQLTTQVEQNKVDAVEKINTQLNEEYGSTAYASYATLMLVKTKVQQGDLETAKSLLKKVMQQAKTSELKHIARLRLIKLMLATGQYEDGLRIIAEADQTTIEGFSANYDELTGDLYVALDRLGEARTAYQQAIRQGAKSALLQFKLDDLTATEIVKN